MKGFVSPAYVFEKTRLTCVFMNLDDFLKHIQKETQGGKIL